MSYFKNANGSAEVLEENNFYPFGMKHEGYNVLTGNPSYNYGYNGKELQKETGWSDYGARVYMSDIGRWGVIDPLAETSRRFTPYNYAYNNPVMFIDPDGRKAIAPQAPAESFMAPGGMLEYYSRGGNGSKVGIAAWLGQEEPYTSEDMMTAGGGGSSTTIGDIMRSVGIKLGSLESFMQMTVVLSLRQQLINAGFKDPEKTKALFSDAGKMLQAGIFQDLNNILNYVAKQPINSKVFFQETTKWYIDGKSEGYKILLNVNNIKNVLELGYTIGHEMGHSVTSYFSDTFYENVGSKGRIANNAFGYFSEYVSYSMEEQWGNSEISNAKDYTYMKHGPEARLESARVPQDSIDLVNNNLIKLMKAYNKFITIPNK